MKRDGGKLTGIEVCRGIAASLVVLLHASHHIDEAFAQTTLLNIFAFGHAGVDFFFVISGFIILFVHYQDIDHPGLLKRYIARRLTRLLPTYWVALLLSAVLSSAGRHGPPSCVDLFWSASLLPADKDMVLGVAWTLRYEFVFYALFSILIVSRRIGLILLTCWFLLIGLGSVRGHLSFLPGQIYGSFNFEFFMGMAVAYLIRNHRVPHARLIAVCGLTLFGLSAAFENMLLFDGHAVLGRLAYGVPAALVVLGVAEAERQGLLRIPAVMSGLGSASYSIYLFHLMLIGCLWQALLLTSLHDVLSPVVQFFLLASAGILGGMVVSIWLEHPLIQLVRRRLTPYSTASTRLTKVPRPS